MKEKTVSIEHSVKIIYFHGFNSSPDSDTCKALQNHFGKEHIIAPAYDYINPENAYKCLDALIQPLIKTNEIIFAGTSLGGFWANYFAEKYKLPCVLINPSLKPAVSLIKYVGENINFQTGEKRILTVDTIKNWTKYKSKNTPGIYKTILLGGKDTIVDHTFTRAFFGNKFLIIDEDEGHQINDKKKIIELINVSIINYKLPF